MKKQKQFFAKHKIPIIIISAVVLLAIAGTVTGVILSLRNRNRQDQEKVSDLVEMMADLVNEPVSAEDEPYNPTGENGEEADESKKEIFVRVNKKRNCITVYEKDKDGEFTKPVKAMICSAGYNAPTGTYETSDRYVWKIVNGNVWSQYATRITGNVLFHSVPYAEKSKSSLIAKYYNKLGTNASAGCIRVMVADAKWLMEHCAEGTKVEIYEDDDPGPLGKPASLVVAENEQWDPSDPDSANPWAGHRAVLSGAANRTVERNIEFDYLEGLSGTDTVGNDITSQIQVDTDLDIKKVGTYKVTYTLTDGVGSTDTAEVVYTVSDTREPYFSGIKRQIQVAPNAAVNVEELLDKVYVIDNNEILSNDRIQVHVPEQLVEGENTVSYSVMDDYGNVATASTLIMVDREPPQLHLYSDAGSILDNSQIVDENFALSRVYATDSGEELPRDSIHVTIYQTDWGYTFVYVATDKSGQTATLTDSVSYVSYTITTTGTLNVTELTAEQLMQGVTLTASTGQTLSGENVQISMNNTISNQYTITYSYTYSSPLGTKTATATRPVILTQQPPMAGPSATPGPGASTPPGPEQTSPAATMEPTNSEDNELISS